MLLTAIDSSKKKTLFARILVHSRVTAGFTQPAAFTRARSAILQSQGLNLRLESALKILIHESYVSKNDRVSLLF